ECSSMVLRFARGSCHRPALALLRFALRPATPTTPRPRAIHSASRGPAGATRAERCRGLTLLPQYLVHGGDELLHVIDGGAEFLLFLLRELDLDDRFDPASADPNRYARVHAVHTVLAF